MSQLDLAFRAGFSSRHVSFIETGRTQPSRQTLLDLAEALDVPLRERNRLLEAGGYAQFYRHTSLAAEELLELRLFSTIMTLGTPHDVTLQELRIETFFPTDPESEEAWARITATSQPGA